MTNTDTNDNRISSIKQRYTLRKYIDSVRIVLGNVHVQLWMLKGRIHWVNDSSGGIFCRVLLSENFLENNELKSI